MEDIKKIVKQGYAKIANQNSSCCSNSCCCGDNNSAYNISKGVGYSENEMNSVPENANLGLGCGNPVAIASLKPGETVLDLGSGAGFDCFLSANQVGHEGKVIGVDMTPEMIEKARANAKRGDYKNVEFRLGEIEDLPVEDNSVDIIISNCVINLSPDKKRVFKEAYRVLKASGRIMVSDIVLLKPLDESIKSSIYAYVGCISGAILKNDYINAIKEAGFNEIKIIDESHFPVDWMANDATAKAIVNDKAIKKDNIENLLNSVISIKVYAKK